MSSNTISNKENNNIIILNLNIIENKLIKILSSKNSFRSKLINENEFVPSIVYIIESIIFEYQRRGFICDACLYNNDEVIFALDLTPLLVSKLSLQHKMSEPLSTNDKRNEDINHIHIYYNSIELLKRIDYRNNINISKSNYNIKLKSVWLSHISYELNIIKSNHSLPLNIFKANPISNEKFSQLTNYYGPGIGTYFSYLDYYTHSLFLPSLFGLILTFIQNFISNDSIYLPVYCISLCIWSTSHLEYWKLRNKELDIMWKSFNVQKKPIIHANNILNLQPIIRILISTVTCFTIFIILIFIMIFYYNYQLEMKKLYSSYTLYYYLPTAFYSIIPIIASSLFSPIAKFLTKFEDHATEAEYHRNYIIKIFSLQFINRYCSLFYATFYLKDFQLLQSLLATLLITNAIINNVLEVFVPYLFINKKIISFKDKNYSIRLGKHLTHVKHSNINNDITFNEEKALNTASSKSNLFHIDTSDINDDNISTISKLNVKTIKHKNIFDYFKKSKKSNSEIDDSLAFSSSIDKSDDSTYISTKKPDSDFVYDDNTKSENEKIWKDRLLREISLSHYNIDDDYLELVLQYGYITMFAVVFPIAPLLGYINNVYEPLVDLTKLGECKRVLHLNRDQLGGWFLCLEIISFIGVITNSYLLCMVSNQIENISSLSNYFDAYMTRFVIMIILEHILVILKLVLKYNIENTSNDVIIQNLVNKENDIEVLTKLKLHCYIIDNYIIKYLNRNNYGFDKSIFNEDIISRPIDKELFHTSLSNEYPMINLLLSDLFPIIKQKDNVTAVDNNISNETIPSNRSTKSLASDISNQVDSYKVNPKNYIYGILLPIALLTYMQLYNVMYFYLVVLIFYFYYIQNKLDRINQTDYIKSNSTKFKPSYLVDSDYQRVEWINMILVKLWPYMSLAGSKMARDKFEKMDVNKYLPKFIAYMNLIKVSLGDIPPTIVGMRIFESEGSNIKMDWEIRYAGNADVILKLGTQPVATTLEISDISISMNLRVEFCCFTTLIPCIGGANVSFLQSPSFDFSFKVAGMDIMNIGPKEFGLAKVVKNVINAMIRQQALYPNKVFVQMLSSAEVEEKKSPIPVGIVTINIEKATHLTIADIVSSDPYVEIISLDQVHETSTKYRNLNPVFNESFDILIYDKQSQIIEFNVFDRDLTNASDFIGKTIISVDKLQPYELESYNRQLDGVKTGNLFFSCLYINLVNNNITLDSNNSVNNNSDLLYNISYDELMNDIIHIRNNHMISQSIEKHEIKHKISYDVINKSKIYGVLTISNIRCRSLKSITSHSTSSQMSSKHVPIHSTSHRASIINAMKVYVNFYVNDIKKSTYINKTTQGDPSFDSVINYVLRDDPYHVKLVVKVKDNSYISNNKKIIGELSIKNILEPLINNRLSIDKEYVLTSDIGQSYISFCLTWVDIEQI